MTTPGDRKEPTTFQAAITTDGQPFPVTLRTGYKRRCRWERRNRARLFSLLVTILPTYVWGPWGSGSAW